MVEALWLLLMAAIVLIDIGGIVAFGLVMVRGIRKEEPFSMAVGMLVVLACCASLSATPFPPADRHPLGMTDIEG